MEARRKGPSNRRKDRRWDREKERKGSREGVIPEGVWDRNRSVGKRSSKEGLTLYNIRKTVQMAPLVSSSGEI